MAKTRRVIKDAEKSASVSREQVETAAKKIKENRPMGTHKAKPHILKRAPRLQRQK